MRRIAEFIKRQRLDVKFEIGRLNRRAGFRKRTQLRRRHGQRAGAEQGILQSHFQFAEPAVGLLVQGTYATDLEGHAQLQVVLEILAHARQNLPHVDAVVLQ